MIITSENIKTIINALIENIDYKLKAINKTINKNTKKASNALNIASNALNTANNALSKANNAENAAITALSKASNALNMANNALNIASAKVDKNYVDTAIVVAITLVLKGAS